MTGNMNKLNERKTTLHIAKKAASLPTPAAHQRPLSPVRRKYTGDPPLRAAQGDDNIMSEEPWVNERG